MRERFLSSRGETTLPSFLASRCVQQQKRELILTRGPTRPEVHLSEARSYANLAAANQYFGLIPTPQVAHVSSARILLEERALDSYSNILFSLTEFWRARAAWPRRLTIVSHAFKRARLVDAHCGAIGLPLHRVGFVGISPPGLDAFGSSAQVLEQAAAQGLVDREKAAKMMDVHAVVGQWAADPHGVGEALAGKRRQRNCWNVDQLLFRSEEERARSGVKTVILQDGAEALAEDADRPWATSDP